MTYARQFTLPFPDEFRYDTDAFLTSKGNAAALAWIDRPEVWPAARLAVQGSAGVGKTHLLHVFARRHRAALIRAETVRCLMTVPEAASFAIDDADTIPDSRALLHIMNIAAECGKSVLLAGRTAPSHWDTDLPDLASRLRSMSVVAISPPDASLLRALLGQFLSARQLQVSERLREYLLNHLPRTGDALREAVARLDRLALAKGGQITFALAASVVDAFPVTLTDRPDTDLTSQFSLTQRFK